VLEVNGLCQAVERLEDGHRQAETLALSKGGPDDDWPGARGDSQGVSRRIDRITSGSNKRLTLDLGLVAVSDVSLHRRIEALRMRLAWMMGRARACVSVVSDSWVAREAGEARTASHEDVDLRVGHFVAECLSNRHDLLH
jgi:hypothetical protein